MLRRKGLRTADMTAFQHSAYHQKLVAHLVVLNFGTAPHNGSSVLCSYTNCQSTCLMYLFQDLGYMQQAVHMNWVPSGCVFAYSHVSHHMRHRGTNLWVDCLAHFAQVV